MKNLKKVMEKYMMIENEKELKRNKLTLTEHDELFRVLMELYKQGYSETIMEGVKNWMVKNGARAIEEGIGWKIS